MSDREQKNSSQFDEMANKGKGMQGIDKAPGEETSRTTENPVTETQKGKNKVDGDPLKESDQPVRQ